MNLPVDEYRTPTNYNADGPSFRVACDTPPFPGDCRMLAMMDKPVFDMLFHAYMKKLLARSI
jgi:hypothetical protein